MATKTVEPDLTRAQLMRVVRTGAVVDGVGKMRALAALERLKRKDVGSFLLDVVADEEQAPRFRHMAVMGLYRLGGARANEALGAAAEHADALSAATIAMALGRVGTADRLAVLERLATVAAPHARRQARFGATLLAYRYGLGTHAVRPPTSDALQELGRRRSQSIVVAKARPALAARALEALAEEPLEIDLSTKNAIRIACEPNEYVWLWATEAEARGLSALTDRKGVAGVLFRKRRFANAYALSAIWLGTPVRAGVRLTVHRAESGQILYAGTVAVDGTLELKARDFPGLPAIAVTAQVAAGRVEVVTAKSASRVLNARKPKPA